MPRALRTLCLVFTAALLMAATVWAAPPYVPSDPVPADGATDVGMRPRLEWTGGDPDPEDTVRYYISIIGSGSPCGGQTLWDLKTRRTRKRIPKRQPLPPDANFSWTVNPVDSNQESPPPEDTWQFSTGSYPFICSIVPHRARPTYVVDIYGVNFGEEPGAVKIGKEWVWADNWGKVLSWSDEHIRLVLPDHRYWDSVPGTFKVRVRTTAGMSNFKKIYVEYGGGGTTW